MFRKLTPQQRACYACLRALGGRMTVTPQDARPLAALKARGIVRYERDDSGARVAVLRLGNRARAQAREQRAMREWERWNLTRADVHAYVRGDK